MESILKRLVIQMSQLTLFWNKFIVPHFFFVGIYCCPSIKTKRHVLCLICLVFFLFLILYRHFYIKQISATTKSRSDGRGIFRVLFTKLISYSFTPFVFFGPFIQRQRFQNQTPLIKTLDSLYLYLTEEYGG